MVNEGYATYIFNKRPHHLQGDFVPNTPVNTPQKPRPILHHTRPQESMRPIENDPYDEIPAYNNFTPSYGRQYQPLNPSRGGRGRGFSHQQAMHRGTGRGTFKYPQQQQRNYNNNNDYQQRNCNNNNYYQPQHEQQPPQLMDNDYKNSKPQRNSGQQHHPRSNSNDSRDSNDGSSYNNNNTKNQYHQHHQSDITTTDHLTNHQQSEVKVDHIIHQDTRTSIDRTTLSNKMHLTLTRKHQHSLEIHVVVAVVVVTAMGAINNNNNNQWSNLTTWIILKNNSMVTYNSSSTSTTHVVVINNNNNQDTTVAAAGCREVE